MFSCLLILIHNQIQDWWVNLLSTIKLNKPSIIYVYLFTNTYPQSQDCINNFSKRYCIILSQKREEEEDCINNESPE